MELKKKNFNNLFKILEIGNKISSFFGGGNSEDERVSGKEIIFLRKISFCWFY